MSSYNPIRKKMLQLVKYLDQTYGKNWGKNSEVDSDPKLKNFHHYLLKRADETKDNQIYRKF